MADLNVGSVRADITADSSKFHAGIQGVKQGLQTVVDAAKNTGRSLLDLGRTGDALQNQLWAIQQRSQLLGKEYDANAAKASALRGAIEQLTLEGHKASEEEMKRLAAEYQKTTQAMRDAEKSSATLTDRLKEQAAGFRTIAIAAGAALAGITLGLKQVVTANNEAKAAFMGLDSVAEHFGISANTARDAARSLADDGLAPTTTYATALRNLLTAGLGLPEATRLLEVFKDRAAFGRKETVAFGTAIDNLAQSFKTEQSRLADNSGMTENYSQLVERGAQILGKKVSELTNAERAQAKYLAILEASAPFEGNAARAADTAAGAQGRWAKATLELSQALGSALEPTLKDALDLMTSAAKAVGSWVRENSELARTLTVIVTTLVAAAAAFGTVALAAKSLGVAMATLGGTITTWFGVGGLILAGLAAIIASLADIRREAALAQKDLADINDIKEAQELVDLRAKELRFAQERYDYLTKMQQRFGGIVDDAEVINAQKNLAIAKEHLATLTREAKAREDAKKKAVEDTVAKRTATDVLQDMEKALAAAETKERLLGDAFDLNQAKASIFNKALNELAEMGLASTDERLQDVARRLQAVTGEMDALAQAAERANEALERDLSFAAADIAYEDQLPPELRRDFLEAVRGVETELDKVLESDKRISMDSLIDYDDPETQAGIRAGIEAALQGAQQNLESDKLISMDSLIDFDSPEVQAGIAAGAKHAGQLAAQEAERVAAEEAARRAESDAAARKAMADGWSKYYADREAAEKALTATITNTAASAVTALLDAGRGVQGFFESLFGALRAFVAQAVAQSLAKIAAVKKAMEALQAAITDNPLLALLGLGAGILFGSGGGESEAERQAREAAEEAKRKWQEVADSIKGALTNAFHAETYTDFLKELGEGIERVVKDGLIKAFLESAAIKPLLDQLVNAILGGADKSIIQSLIAQIGDLSKQFYEQLQGINFDFSSSVAAGNGGVVNIAPQSPAPVNMSINIYPKSLARDELVKEARLLEPIFRDLALGRA